MQFNTSCISIKLPLCSLFECNDSRLAQTLIGSHRYRFHGCHYWRSEHTHADSVTRLQTHRPCVQEGQSAWSLSLVSLLWFSTVSGKRETPLRVGLTCGDLDEAKQDDDDQRQQLGGRKQVLDLGGCSHADTVHKRQRGCGR